ncbi:MAG TPA: zinc-ribbon domain containing protein [Rhodocyclaceae bacterium]|nr:zinc-ribbon domain containing protein [Rhodocyclaceae bacterium]
MKAVKSGKQRRAEIKAAREKRKARRCFDSLATPWQRPHPLGAVPVSAYLLQPNNSYGLPFFVERGYYEDKPFRCVDCGAEGVWTAESQRWWYEVIKGDVFTTARRCASCRAKERARKAEARRTHFAGLIAKGMTVPA